MLLSAGGLSIQDYHQVLALRERMNRGGKRRHRWMESSETIRQAHRPRAVVG